jgi:hypothetical protein
MNQVDKISKEALNLLSYSKDVVANNLAALNKEGKLTPQLNELQLKTIVSILESSVSQGFQKGLPTFQKSVNNVLEEVRTHERSNLPVNRR